MEPKIILEHKEVAEILTILGVYDRTSIAQITKLYDLMIEANLTNGIFADFIKETSKLADLKLKDWNYSFEPSEEDLLKEKKEKELLEILIDHGKLMRLTQIEYFRHRTTNSFNKAKKLEKEFDELLRVAKPPEPSAQKSLFGD